MTTEQLRQAHRAKPFRPFSIRLANGQRYSIPNPDSIALAPTGRTAAIWHDDGSASLVDLPHMIELEFVPAQS